MIGWCRCVVVLLVMVMLPFAVRRSPFAVRRSPFAVWGMNADQRKKFDQIMRMKMSELTVAAKEQLAEKYPDEDWNSHSFPRYARSSDSVRNGYRIALKEPELLGGVESGIPCYCSCDAFGHKSLLACFIKDGKLDNGFDTHGADCNI